MATVQTNKSPMHITCTVRTALWKSAVIILVVSILVWISHKVELLNKIQIFIVVLRTGKLFILIKTRHGNGGSPDLGNQVQIFDKKNNVYFRYCHMLEGSVSVNVGDIVNTSTFLRKNGKHRKFNRYTLALRMFKNSKLAMSKFCESWRIFRNTKYSWNYCGV